MNRRRVDVDDAASISLGSNYAEQGKRLMKVICVGLVNMVDRLRYILRT